MGNGGEGACGPRPAQRGLRRSLATLGALALLAACASPPEGPGGSGELVSRAERACGLPFLRPVDVRKVAPAEVRALLARELDATIPEPDLRRRGRLLAWVGMLPPDADLRALLLDFSATVAGGFYAPIAGRVFRVAVPGGFEPPAASAEAVLVHELCHALQDQNGVLLRLGLALRDDDDAAFALAALLEGEALLAEVLDREARTGEAPPVPTELAAEFDLRALAAEHPEVPRYVREGLALRYLAGYRLVFEARVVRGLSRGWLWFRPPLSSAQVLHPERLLDGEEASSLHVAPPDGVAPAGCRELARNHLGELGLRIWLEEGGVPSAEAEAAGSVLRGDLLQGFACREGGALAWMLEAASPDGRRLLREALTKRLMGHRPTAGLRGAMAIRCTARRCLLSAGLSRAVARSLLLGARERPLATVGDLLEVHPALRERLRALGAVPPAAARPRAWGGGPRPVPARRSDFRGGSGGRGPATASQGSTR